MHLIWLSTNLIELSEGITHTLNFDIWGRRYHFYSVDIDDSQQLELSNLSQRKLNEYIRLTYKDPDPSFASVEQGHKDYNN